MKPFQVFLFFLAVGLTLLLTALYFPKEGIRISDGIVLKYVNVDDLFKEEEVKIKDMEAFLKQYETPIDSTAIKDSLERAKLAYRKAMLRIQWPDSNRQKLFSFFEKLEKVKSGDVKKIRIMHYGDSQIEGDRITSYIRNEMQKEYGGYGPGLLPVVEGVPSSAIRMENSDNWYRFTIFGRRDTNIRHSRYAPLGSMAMFEYPVPDTVLPDTSLKTAWVTLMPSRIGHSRVKRYSDIALYYGFVPDAMEINTYVNDSLIEFEDTEAYAGFLKRKWHFDRTPEALKIEFVSHRSPEFYAFSLESPTGVIMDNIAMRGSSGTLFKKLDRQQFGGFIGQQPVGMFLLQFGGNTVPYIKSEEQAERYSRWMKSQIRYLQSLKPEAVFIVIGPSDMATKVLGKYITYPFLEDVRDALKNAAFETGCGFWDLFEVMGGKNSMTSWVEADPPLAGKDYVHFTHRGTKKVSQLFYKALIEDRKDWKVEKGVESAALKNDTLTVKPAE